jgi:hypothetical protein
MRRKASARRLPGTCDVRDARHRDANRRIRLAKNNGVRFESIVESSIDARVLGIESRRPPDLH